MTEPRQDAPSNLRYTDDHEWARLDGDIVTIGVTAFAQDALGDLTYVELPDAGDSVDKGDGVGVVESVKTFSDLYAPVGGEIIEVNTAAADDPTTINTTPYTEGWIVKIKVTSTDEFEALMDATAYLKHLESED
ncbi:MAG: glycine cleavage system H protein [Bradymonadia bacterium]|jgi:glycine cleavage system H protein